MNAFVCAHELEPQKRRQSRLRSAKAAGRGAAQDRADMLWNVEGFPGRTIGILPFRIRHFGMMRHAMIEVVLVHVGIHPDPVLPKDFMVLVSASERLRYMATIAAIAPITNGIRQPQALSSSVVSNICRT